MHIEDGDIMNKDTREFVRLLNKTQKKPPAIVQFLMMISMMLLCGTTIMFLWNWYISQLGLPTINLFHALGVDMLGTFIVTRSADTNNSSVGSLEQWLSNMVYSALTLLLGFIFHFFI